MSEMNEPVKDQGHQCGALSWQVGAVRITSIFEQPLLDIEQLIPGVTPAILESAQWLKPSFVGEDGKMVGAIQAFVVQTEGKTIVVDCCVGDGKDRPVFARYGWHRSQHGFLNRLAAAGIAREDVDIVLCTHLHLDHVGWNTMQVGGQWVPTFPRARYLVARREFDHLKSELAGSPVLAQLGIDADELLALLAEPGRLHDGTSTRALTFEQVVHGAMDLANRQTWADSILPVIEAGQIDLVDDDHEVCPEVTLIPTNGHTPGHVSVRIRSGSHEALISGDAIHHPVQMAAPGLSTISDGNPSHAVETRRKLLASLATNRSLLIGTHFAAPTAGWVREEGAGYRLCCEGHSSSENADQA